MDKLLNKLIPPVSVSGCEKSIATVIAELAKPYGQVSTDPIGNLIVHRPGTGKRIMLAAHMDSIGLIVTYVEENGFVRFGNIGGLRLGALLNQRVSFENGVVGVVCCESGVGIKDLTLDKLYVDTAGQKVQVGDTAAFCGAPYYAGDKVVSPYLDNRLGCAVCLKALEQLENCSNDIYVVFTVQEEVGLRGAKPAAYSIEPEMAIAVDICSTLDIPGEGRKDAVTLEGGPVVKLMDARTISHKAVVELLETTAAELALPVQRLVTRFGGTDAGVIFDSRSGVPTANLSIPIRYTHTPNEMADLRVAAACARLLAAAISK